MKIFNYSIFLCFFLFPPAGQTNEKADTSLSPTKNPMCGDYSILSSRDIQSMFENHCGTNNEKDFEQLRNLARGLDAKKEAIAAAKRGDYRLAAFTDGGPPPPENTRRWTVAGAHCKHIEDEDVFIWVRLSDALTPLLDQAQGEMVRFAKNYNSIIISQKNFPTTLGCQSSPNAKMNG